MDYDRFLKFLGLGARAGKLVYGAHACEAAIKTGKAKLIVVDNGASENTKKSFGDACKYYNIKLIILEEEDSLTKYLAKKTNKVIGVVCPDFARSALLKYGMSYGGETIE